MSCVCNVAETLFGGPITGAIVIFAGWLLAGGGLATEAVGVSLDEPKSDAPVSQPARPKAINPALRTSAIGFLLRQAGAVSKVVTATFPR
ncbi:MAG: hypothetical protein V3S34_05595 [Hyphomicrobium sp.]